MGFGWNSSPYPKQSSAAKPRVASVLPPKRRQQSYSLSNRTYSSRGSSQSSFQQECRQQQQPPIRRDEPSLHLSQQSHSSDSRRGRGSNAPPSGQNQQQQSRQNLQFNPHSSRNLEVERSTLSERASSEYRPVYNDDIPLGQESDFGSESSSSSQRENYRGHEQLPSSQNFCDSQSSGYSSQKGILLESQRSKPFNKKTAHFAGTARNTDTPPPYGQPPTEFLSQDSFASRSSMGPPRTMPSSQSGQYGSRSLTSTFTSTISSSQQSHSYMRKGSSLRNTRSGKDATRALMTRRNSPKPKAHSPSPDLAFANHAVLRKSQVEKQKYPEIGGPTEASDRPSDPVPPTPRTFVRTMKAEFEAAMKQNKEESRRNVQKAKDDFDRHAQEATLAAVAKVESKASDGVSRLEKETTKGEDILREATESGVTTIQHKVENVLGRLEEEEIKAKKSIGIALANGVQTLKSQSTEGVKKITSTVTTVASNLTNQMKVTASSLTDRLTTKYLSVFSKEGKGLSMVTSPSNLEAARGNYAVAKSGSTAKGKKAKNYMVTPLAPAMSPKNRNEKTRKASLTSLPATKRTRRRKKEKANATPSKTEDDEEKPPPIQNIEFAPMEENQDQNEFSTQSSMISPVAKSTLKTKPKTSSLSPPPTPVVKSKPTPTSVPAPKRIQRKSDKASLTPKRLEQNTRASKPLKHKSHRDASKASKVEGKKKPTDRPTKDLSQLTSSSSKKKPELPKQFRLPKTSSSSKRAQSNERLDRTESKKRKVIGDHSGSKSGKERHGLNMTSRVTTPKSTSTSTHLQTTKRAVKVSKPASARKCFPPGSSAPTPKSTAKSTTSSAFKRRRSRKRKKDPKEACTPPSEKRIKIASDLSLGIGFPIGHEATKRMTTPKQVGIKSFSSKVRSSSTTKKKRASSSVRKPLNIYNKSKIKKTFSKRDNNAACNDVFEFPDD